MAEAPARRRASFKDTLLTLLAICVALLFVFPLYWAFSTSLRNPIDTFTVAGFGIPWLNFEPTLDNWIEAFTSPSIRNSRSSSLPVCCARRYAPSAMRWGVLIMWTPITSP